MNSGYYLKNETFIFIALIVLTIVFPTGSFGMANPASVNCIEKGGELSIQKRGDGGEYGICIFKGNRQCEEWAMFRGECPEGGVDVTGHTTPAARMCVITGGTYTAADKKSVDTEEGTCTLKNGTICSAWDYYNGKCIGTDKIPK